MRWILVRNAVIFAVNSCMKLGEKRRIIFFSPHSRLSPISFINFQQMLMRWIFIRNALNCCKKCGEMRWNFYFHRIHRNRRIFSKIRRIHRISYKNLPNNLNPGCVTTMWSGELIIKTRFQEAWKYWFKIHIICGKTSVHSIFF